MYDEPYDWLILGNDLEKILNIIDDTAFGISTNFIIAISNENENDYKLYDVYNSFKERGGVLNVTVYGEWNTKNGLTVSLTQFKLTRRFNLHGLRLKAMFFKVCMIVFISVVFSKLHIQIILDNFLHRATISQKKYLYLSTMNNLKMVLGMDVRNMDIILSSTWPISTTLRAHEHLY